MWRELQKLSFLQADCYCMESGMEGIDSLAKKVLRERHLEGPLETNVNPELLTTCPEATCVPSSSSILGQHSPLISRMF